MQTNIIFDGHDALSGIEGGNPVLLSQDKCANSVNRFYRNDFNETRPPFRELVLSFASDDDETTFRTGNVQGAFFYHGRPPTTGIAINGSVPLYWPNYIVAAIAGSLFSIQLAGNTGVVTKIASGNNPALMHTWFAQGYEWLFAQNGEQTCLVWNGQDASKAANLFRAQPASLQIPTGGPMAFIYGRMVVSSADGRNQIAVGDIAYGNHQNNSSDIWMFTDQTYWNEAGYFDIAADLGDIMGLVAMPYLDTGNGQNELVVLCRNGATSFDFSSARTNWLNTQVQRISLIGMGCESTHSLALLNGDLIYKSSEGIRSYKNSRNEFASSYTQTPMSNDVSRWLDQENLNLLEFNSQMSWNNMLFSTVMPMLARNETTGWGYHRYHRGMVVLDCEPQSRLGQGNNPAWQGLWTGPRPTALVNGIDGGVDRAFCFSFDTDGRNRVYEFMDSGAYDYSNGARKTIVSMYDTPAYCGQQSDRFTHKRLMGASIELSGIVSKVGLGLSYKPDNAPCFVDWKQATVGCDCKIPENCSAITQQPGWTRRNFGNPLPDAACVNGSNYIASIFRAAQFRVKLTGTVTVDRLGILMQAKEQTNKEDCQPPENCVASTCCPATDEFSYSFP